MNEHPKSVAFEEIQATIAKRAWEDPAFEAEFMADPKAALARQLGAPLPDSIRVHAHHSSPTELHFVIPKRPAQTEELTDDDLERVAGGEGVFITALSVTIWLPTPVTFSI